MFIDVLYYSCSSGMCKMYFFVLLLPKIVFLFCPTFACGFCLSGAICCCSQKEVPYSFCCLQYKNILRYLYFTGAPESLISPTSCSHINIFPLISVLGKSKFAPCCILLHQVLRIFYRHHAARLFLDPIPTSFPVLSPLSCQ